jgi:mannose-6-phosphate isomerase-like protein (cupin superfamily)
LLIRASQESAIGLSSTITLMIHRSSKNAQKLDVAGLNEITVLIDRSETALTEVAFNSWSPGLDGPPHAHDAKEQNFFLLSGRGEIVIGADRFPAAPGDFFYVPAGVVHQSVNLNKDQRLDYFLFNAFLDSSKEGHASFAAHINLVKETRRKQADSQQSGVQSAAGANTRRGLKVATQSLSSLSTTLVGRSQTQKCEAVHHAVPAGLLLAFPADATKEQTFYIQSGAGRFVVGKESVDVAAGETVFIPAGTSGSITAGTEGLTAVSFGTIL